MAAPSSRSSCVRRPLPARPALERAVTERLGHTSSPTEGLGDASVAFDDGVSPWHTVCEVRAPDRPGLLHEIAAAFAAAHVSVHAARLSADGGVVVDRFDVTTANGEKLDAAHQTQFGELLRSGVKPRRHRVPRALLAAVGQKAAI